VKCLPRDGCWNLSDLSSQRELAEPAETCPLSCRLKRQDSLLHRIAAATPGLPGRIPNMFDGEALRNIPVFDGSRLSTNAMQFQPIDG
jgi:hypothetical protein